MVLHGRGRKELTSNTAAQLCSVDDGVDGGVKQ